MSSVFRVLRKPIALQPDRASNVVMSCILLHNFSRNSTSSNNIYVPPGFADTIIDGQVVPGTWRNEQQEDTALRSFPAVARPLFYQHRSGITLLNIFSVNKKYVFIF